MTEPDRFMMFAARVMAKGFELGGNFDEDKDGRARIVAFFEGLRPTLPPGFVPNPLPVDQLVTLAKTLRNAKK